MGGVPLDPGLVARARDWNAKQGSGASDAGSPSIGSDTAGLGPAGKAENFTGPLRSGDPETYGQTFTRKYMSAPGANADPLAPALKGATRYIIDYLPEIVSTVAAVRFGRPTALGASASELIGQAARTSGIAAIAGGAAEIAQKGLAGEVATPGQVATQALIQGGTQLGGEGLAAVAPLQRAYKKLGGVVVEEAAQTAHVIKKLVTEHADVYMAKTGVTRAGAERAAKTALTAAQMTYESLLDEADNFLKSSWVGGHFRAKFSRGIKAVLNRSIDDTVESLGPKLEPDDLVRWLGKAMDESESAELKPFSALHEQLATKMRTVHAPEIEPGLAGPGAPGGIARSDSSVMGVRSGVRQVGQQEVPGTGGSRVTGVRLVPNPETTPGGSRVTGVQLRPNPPQSVMDPTRFESGLAGPGAPRGLPIIEGGGQTPTGGHVEMIPGKRVGGMIPRGGRVEMIPPETTPVNQTFVRGGRASFGPGSIIVQETGSQAGMVNLAGINRDAIERNFAKAGQYDAFTNTLKGLDEHVPGKADFGDAMKFRSDLSDAIRKAQTPGQDYNAKFVREATGLKKQLTQAMENAAKDYDRIAGPAARARGEEFIPAHTLMKDADLGYFGIKQYYHPKLTQKILEFAADAPNAVLNGQSLVDNLKGGGPYSLMKIRQMAGGESSQAWRGFRQMVVSTALKSAEEVPGKAGSYNASKLLEFVNNQLGENASNIVLGTHKTRFMEAVNALEYTGRANLPGSSMIAQRTQSGIVTLAIAAAAQKATGLGKGVPLGTALAGMTTIYGLTTLGLSRILASPATTELLLQGVRTKAFSKNAVAITSRLMAGLIEGEDYVKQPQTATPAELGTYHQAVR